MVFRLIGIRESIVPDPVTFFSSKLRQNPSYGASPGEILCFKVEKRGIPEIGAFQIWNAPLGYQRQIPI